MTRTISAAHLTAIDLTPPDFVEAAARAGFDAVGLRLIRVTEASPGYPLMQDAAMLRATQAALRASGLFVNDIEFIRLTPDFDPASLAGFLDAGAELGARQVITAPYDPDLDRMADRLAALDALAADRGLGVVLEFFPWTVVPDLAACWNLVRQAGPRIGILADSLHMDRSGSDPGLLAQLPPSRLPFAHLCDAPVAPAYTADELLFTAREARLPPGEGKIDLAGFLRALPPDTPLGLEVPMDALARAEGSEAVLTRVARATRTLLAGAARIGGTLTTH